MIRIRTRRVAASVAALALAASGLVATALATAPQAQAAEVRIDNAVFTWELNKESTGGAFAPGTWNLFSAGKLSDPGSGFQLLNSANEGATWSNGAPAGWTNAAGNVTVEDKLADGSYAPTTFQGTRTDSTGAAVNTGSVVSENRIAISSGSGTVDPETDTGTIAWDGDFTVVYYSGYSFFYVSDPTLTVVNGTGTVSATLSGFGASMDDPTKWVTLPATEVVMADLTNVDLTESGFTATPEYLGVGYDAPEGGTAQVRSGEHWGSFPKSWVDFQVQVGTSSYWYSSGGAADPRKPSTPLRVDFSPSSTGPSVVVSRTVLTPQETYELTIRGRNFNPDAVLATRPPLGPPMTNPARPAGAYVVAGRFGQNWAPSAGAPSANRPVAAQQWAVTAEDMATIGGTGAGAIELTPDGSFTATLTVSKAAMDAAADGSANASDLTNYGIYTYAGSGGIHAPYETYTPLTFSDIPSPTNPPPGSQPTQTPEPSPSPRVKAAAAVAVDAKDAVFGAAVPVAVQVSSVQTPTGQVVLRSGEVVLAAADLLAGAATFEVGNLTAGSHQLTATYLGDGAINGASTETNVVIARQVVSVKPKGFSKVKARKRATVSLRLPSAASGKVTLKVKAKSVVNGKSRSFTKTVTNGEVNIKLPNLKRGGHRVVVRYLGDRNHQPLRTTLKFRAR